MSKILVDTIDTRSGTTTLTLGSTNATTLDFDTGITSVTNIPAPLKNTPIFRARMSASQSVSNDTTTKLAFNQEEIDTDGAYDTSNYRFTVPTGKGGYYFVSFMARSSSITDGKKLEVLLNVNGSFPAPEFFQTASSNSSEQYSGIISCVIELSAGQYLEGHVLHQSGSAINFGTSGCLFSGYRLIGA